MRFGAYVVDEGAIELRRNGERVPLEPRVFDVLRYLIEHRERVVTKVELRDAIWGDQFVSDSALASCIKQARQAVGDDGRSQDVIETTYGRGYRFVADIDSVDDDLASAAGPGAASSGPDTAARPGRPRPAARTRRLGPLVGRDTDVAAIRRRLETRNLVSLVGMGGIGKTHLLNHLGAALGEDYEDGAFSVELAPVRSADAVGAAFLESVGAVDTTGPDPVERLLGWLEPRQVLLLIDNAEHVAADVAALCAQVLDRCPEVDLLVTSRTRLDVNGESVQPVGPLDADAAVRLFVERAFDCGADLVADDAELRDLCARLDGVPLALEIMAARAPLLSVADLAANLDRHLRAVHRTDEERHHTLEATLQWSFADLSDEQRRVLGKLTVFAGPFDLPAAEAVADADVTDVLLELCRRSLLVPVAGSRTSRFRLLEPVRLFAASGDDSADDVGSRHAAYYLRVAAEAADRIVSDEIDHGMATMWLEWPNIVAAFEFYSTERDVAAMTELLTATANYSEARLLAEVCAWAEEALDIARAEEIEPDPVLVANLARFSVHTGRLAVTDELLAGIDPADGSTHVRMAFILCDWYQGRLESTLRHIDAAIEDVHGQGGYWEGTLGVIRLISDPTASAGTIAAIDRLEELADGGGLTGALYAQVARGVRLSCEGHPELGAVELDRALAVAEGFGAMGFAQLIEILRARAYRELGEPSRAASVLAESIKRAVASGGWALAAESLGAAANVLSDGGRADVAAQILAARRSAGYRFRSDDDATLRQRIDDALAPDELAANEGLGQGLALGAAVDLALNSLSELAATA